LICAKWFFLNHSGDELGPRTFHGVFLATLHFLDNQRSVRQLTHLSRIRPLKSDDIDLALRGADVAPKPEPARLAFVFGKESRILQPVSPVLVAFSAILLTSVVLLAVDSFIDTEALAFIYLLPVIVMATHYGSTVGVLTSFASAFAQVLTAYSAVNPGATVRGAVERGIPGPDFGTWRSSG